jgi:hypothetical protein
MNAETPQRVGVQPVRAAGGYKGGGTHARCTGLTGVARHVARGYTGVARTLHEGLHAGRSRTTGRNIRLPMMTRRGTQKQKPQPEVEASDWGKIRFRCRKRRLS